MKWKTSDGRTVEMSFKERTLYVIRHMKKAFEASKMPLLYVVVLDILNLASVFLVGIDASKLVLVLFLAIFLWAGYNAVNRFKFDQDDALRTGFITGFIATWINLPLSLLITNSGWVKGASPIPGSMFDLLFDIVIASLVVAFIGGVIASIGAYIALKTKPQKKPVKNIPVLPTSLFSGPNDIGVIMLIFGIYLVVMGVLIQSVLGVSIEYITIIILGVGLFVLGLVIIQSESNQKKKKPKQS